MKRMIPLLFFAVSLCLAQPRDFFPWWELPIVRNIGLNDDQMKQIHSTVREFRDKLIDQRGAIEKAENQLSDIMNDDHPDEKRGIEAINRVASARADLTRTFSQMGFKLRLVLTPAQWRDLQNKRIHQPMPQDGNKPPLPPNQRPMNRNPRPPQNDDAGLYPANPPDGRNVQNPRPRVFDRPDETPNHLFERD
jgi:Spy/CpxP family protein refolding chaperone